MEALFLPPDETADGKNRQQHIREIRKDWSTGKHKEKMIVEFKKTQTLVHKGETLVRTEMSVSGSGGLPSVSGEPLEFKVVFTSDGCKIAAMKYLDD